MKRNNNAANTHSPMPDADLATAAGGEDFAKMTEKLVETIEDEKEDPYYPQRKK